MIAGHANAARGEPILWIFGVDQKQRTVPGVDERDPTPWWAAVEKYFVGKGPEHRFTTVRQEGRTVAVLYVETEDAPFLVVNPQYGKERTKIEREVPWRRNGAVCTATREDLIRILQPLVRVPTLDLVHLQAHGEELLRNSKVPRKEINIIGRGYLNHMGDRDLHIPDRMASGEIGLEGTTLSMPIRSGSLRPPSKLDFDAGAMISAPTEHPRFVRTSDDLAAKGPGMLEIYAKGWLEQPDNNRMDREPDFTFEDFVFTRPLNVHLRFGVVGADASIIVRAQLWPAPKTGEKTHNWVIRKKKATG
jgi:hypothetical protein